MLNLIPPRKPALNWECAQGSTLEIYIDEREDIVDASAEELTEVTSKRNRVYFVEKIYDINEIK